MQATIDKTSADPAATTDRVRVMIIDDNEEFSETVRQLLEPLGYAVTTVANPVKALELFTRDKDKIDLVLVDYFMPAMDGAKTFE
ncbi:MAG: response regulator, partial [Acidobacteria bacterium]|nr:response regulator [Acidobacteriota bacterium]